MKRVRAAVLNCCAGDPENEDSDFEDEVKMTDWKGLPDLALLHIVDLLCPEDVARLAQTCRRFHSLLPRFLVIRGKDFHVRGPTYQQSVTVVPLLRFISTAHRSPVPSRNLRCL